MRLLIDTNVFLFRRGQHATFQEFVKDMFIDAGLSLMALQPEDMEMIVHAACKFGLDFDDAYQYGICEKYNLTLVSLDSDFDRTDRGRKQPGEILAAGAGTASPEQG